MFNAYFRVGSGESNVEAEDLEDDVFVVSSEQFVYFER